MHKNQHRCLWKLRFEGSIPKDWFIRAGKGAWDANFQQILSPMVLLREAMACTADGGLEIILYAESSEQHQNNPIPVGNT